MSYETSANVSGRLLIVEIALSVTVSIDYKIDGDWSHDIT